MSHLFGAESVKQAASRNINLKIRAILKLYQK